MDFQSLIARKRERFQRLESEIADPRLFDNRKRESDTMREHSATKALLAKWAELETTRRQLEDNRELAAAEDADLAQMAQEEIPALEKRVADLEFEVQVALLPPDENDERDAIVEIRAGTGGSEAAIFAADLYRMYNRYAETAGLKLGKLAQPLRAALTGRTTSPGIFDVLLLLGKSESLARIADQMVEPNP